MTPNIPKMVMCNMDNVVIPRPPPLGPLVSKLDPMIPSLGPPPIKALSKISRNSSKNSVRSQGFRLMENQDDTGSVYSVYKQKIDSMFESDSSSTKNSVQAKIEKMFTEVAQDNGIPINEIGVHTFSVDYLGSIPLQEKVTSLSGLQNPLRDLYFGYKKITKHKKALTGRLEISSQGLKVQYQGEKGDLEQLNSFPTIAVWSAVKFVINESSNKYAFLPLITDPDNIDKQSLFKELDELERKYINSESHSPLFAVVMRKIGVHKQLECHGFVCQTSEDAIVIAATLYKSLVAHMKAKEKKPKNRNGVTCMSIASSTYHETNNSSVPVRPPRKKRSTTSSIISESDNLNTSDTQPLLSCSKQPKKSVKTKRAPKVPAQKNQDLDAIMPYEEPVKSNQDNNDKILNDNMNPYNEIAEIKPKTFSDKISTYMSREQKQITEEIKQVMSESTNKGLKKVQSVRKTDDDTIRKKENSGDILTKVTIPRSGSFLNTGGLTRYKSKISRNNDQATGGSPLGFKEIFHELSLQEGLHSMDDILGVIIDPEGMSFNDLKPIYKEFLLKLSVTLTKDELYQRSKSIMRRQKKKLLRRNSSLNTKKSHHILVGGKFKRLKHIFQKSFRSKIGKNGQASLKGDKDIVLSNKSDGKLPESSISTSSYDTRQFRPKEEVQVTRKQSYRKKQGDIDRHRRDRTSTSEESDFFSLRRNKSKSQSLSINNQNRNSSSGYVSCSECSYDSDTCTCVSADKCYCSLGNKHFSRKSSKCTCKTEEKCYCTLDTTLSFCGCDTDSCAESNKCYCQSLSKNNTILEQLKQRGFIPTTDSIVCIPKHRKVCKKNSNTKSTRSVEYMANPSEAYYEKLKSRGRASDRYVSRQQMIIEDPSGRKSISTDNLALDYELFTITNGNYRNIHNGSVYSRSVSERGKIDLRNHESIRSFSSNKYGSRGTTVSSTAITSGQCTEALSVKKSAEIAALFADIKLSQTTDITHLSPRNFDMESIINSRNAYNKMTSHPKYSKPHKGGLNKADIKALNHLSQKMVHNSMYQSTRSNNKNNMYSTKNGLYTIQSQSESGRSSVSDRRSKEKPKYFELEPRYMSNKNDSNNLENSLGYLP